MNRFMLHFVFVFSSAVVAAARSADECTLIQSRVGIENAHTHRRDHDLENRPSLELLDKIKATFTSSDKYTHKVSALSTSSENQGQTCFDAGAWLEEFATQASWKNYSQGDQDAVLHSLFSTGNLGTTNKQFVEFGFPDHDFSKSYGNGRNLKEMMGFNNFLLLDGQSINPEINLHKRFITAANIVETFDHFKVPMEADYVSVDIDSCDLWVFYALTQKYRPRVMTVEYNSNYAFDDYHTLKCADPTAKNAYSFRFDNIFGTSLSAIELAAQKRGYSLVYVTPQLDAFLVRSDLLCPGTTVPKSRFTAATSLPIWTKEYDGKYGPKEELLTDFKEWLAAHA